MLHFNIHKIDTLKLQSSTFHLHCELISQFIGLELEVKRPFTVAVKI